jgi:hypothetical protein
VLHAIIYSLFLPFIRSVTSSSYFPSLENQKNTAVAIPPMCASPEMFTRKGNRVGQSE